MDITKDITPKPDPRDKIDLSIFLNIPNNFIEIASNEDQKLDKPLEQMEVVTHSPIHNFYQEELKEIPCYMKPEWSVFGYFNLTRADLVSMIILVIAWLVIVCFITVFCMGYFYDGNSH